MADNIVKSDITSGISSLHSFQNFKNSFPPNLAGTDFAASRNVALVLYTDAPSIGVYQNLTAHQNAQLLLNVCNANLNETYNTICVFGGGGGGGARIHVKGTKTSNTHWRSPIKESDVTLPASDPSIAQGIIDQFKAQGGYFPVVVGSNENTPLPEPTKTPNGPATRYCLEGRSAEYDIVYHSFSKNTDILPGPCPEDPDLHYYQ